MTNDVLLYPICILNIINIISAHLAELHPGSKPVIPNQPSSAPNNVNPSYVKETVSNFGLYTGYNPAFMSIFNYLSNYIYKVWMKYDDIAKYTLDPMLCDLTPPRALQPFVGALPHMLSDLYKI